MAQTPMNLLYLFTDQHSKFVTGCYGNPYVYTPNLDRLAGRGVRFTNAYCNNPICVPSRASMSIGDYGFRHSYWDNSFPYAAKEDSWGTRLVENGYPVTTIGKLHYKDAESTASGFPDQRIPLHVRDGIGDLTHSIRDGTMKRPALRQVVLDAGPGDSDYIHYDRKVAQLAAEFLTGEGKDSKKPFCLFVGFVCPHFPWKVPPEIMKRYEPYEHLPRPIQWDAGERPMHPAIVKHRRELFLEEMFSEEEMRQAVAAYYGMTTFVDSQIGIVLDALKAAWLEENTRIIYTDDHGDSVGDHGLFFKHTMYEGSVGIPMLMAGPDLPQGITVDTCVSLLDIFPTVLDNFGLVPGEADRSLPGKSLFRVIGGDREERPIFAESHCIGFDDSVFMLRYRQYKYVYYAGGYEPQLFDLAADPHECRDLAGDPAYQEVRRMLDAELKKIADPEALSARAKQEQWDHMMAMGGKERAMGQLMAYSPTPKV